MNTYSAHKTPSFDWTKAFLVSIAVHVLFVALWIGAILLEVFTVSARDFVDEIIAEEEYLSIPAEFVEAFQEAQALAETPAPEPTRPEKSFVPTRPSQETSEPVQSSRYFGERSTAAASEGEVVDNGLEVPSQEGRDPRYENELELANSNFADSEEEGAPGTPGEPRPLSPTELTSEVTPKEPTQEANETAKVLAETPVFEPNEPAEPIEPIEAEEVSNEERIKQAQKKAVELLALDESIPVPKEEEEPEPEEEAVAEEAIPEPKPQPQAQPPRLAGGVSGNRGLNSGFDREAKRTRLSGTIRRRGESSLEVEDSIKGRFLAEVNREVERAWQRECILRREYILPGVLSLSFSIDQTGGVSGFRFDSRIAGGAIQEGFTMRAIQKAKLPEMPKEMVEELSGDQLELNLTFMF